MSRGEVLSVVLLIITGAIFVFTAGIINGSNAVYQDAIDNGAAEWTIDPKTGDKSFTWIECSIVQPE